MIEEFLAAAREVRSVVSSNQTGKGSLPSNRQPFEAFEEAPIEKRFYRQNDPGLRRGSPHFGIRKNGGEDRIGRFSVGVRVEIQDDAVPKH